MEKIVSEKFGCKIIERDFKFFIQYDNGQSASWIVENEITKDKVEKAIISAQSAYEVILSAENRTIPRRVI